jgi:hypothetical protein
MEKTIMSVELSERESVILGFIFEIRETGWELYAKTKEMSVDDYFRFVANSTVKTLDGFGILLIRSLTSLINKRNTPKYLIAAAAEVSVEEIEKITALAEEIENKELIALAEERINSYGGWEEANKKFISHDDFWRKLGITGDLSEVREYEIG